ncbi:MULTISPECIES: hypothetical protein [Levilactobacillus]|uniref:hypothetical protein n=1 Tax=Levilactobacillus TaxID=2767886 RepID=UPI003757A629
MENKENVMLRRDIYALDKRTDKERVRYSLYSIYINILLSKSLFQKNDDIKKLSSELNFSLKDYVYRSRTLIIARYVKKIEELDSSAIDRFLDVAKDFVPEETTSRHIKKNRKASTFDKFGRG